MGFWSPLAMIMYDMSDDYDFWSVRVSLNDGNPTCLFEPIMSTYLPPFCLEAMKTTARLSFLPIPPFFLPGVIVYHVVAAVFRQPSHLPPLRVPFSHAIDRYLFGLLPDHDALGLTP